MVIIFLLVICCIFLISSQELTDEQKKIWEEASESEKEVMSTKLSFFSIIKLLIDDTELKSTACYNGAQIIAECPKDTIEIIFNTKPRSRSCYKKCKENEIRIENVCYYCKNGKQIQERVIIYGLDYERILCGYNGEEEAEFYFPEEVPLGHCMKNTIKDWEGCYKDCGILGLKPFGNNAAYCAKDEDDFNQFKWDQIKIFSKYAVKTIFGNMIGKIFAPKIEYGLTNSIKQYLILLHRKFDEKNISNLIFNLKVNTYLKKKFLEQIGEEVASKFVTNYITNLVGNISDKLIDKIEIFIHILMGRMIDKKKVDKIDSKKKLDKIMSKLFDNLMSFFDIFELREIGANCYKSKEEKEEFDFEKCAESIMNTLEDLDPTMFIGFLKTINSLYPPLCDIEVEPEYSKELLFWGGNEYPILPINVL